MNYTYRKPTALRRFFAMLAVFALVASYGAPVTTIAEVGQDNGSPRVTICHATASETNPYVQQTVAEPSVLGPGGHGVSGVNIGDIIPPIDGLPEGNNWTESNQAIYNNDCNVPDEPVSGCMDPAATNYDPNATMDDGSCVYPALTTGTIVVKKEFGSTTTPVSFNLFSFFVNGGASVTFDVSGENTLTEQATGTYNIVEAPVSDYTASYDNCTFDLVAGETQTCTITNTYVPPSEQLCEDETANNFGQPLPCTYDDPVVNSCLVPDTLGDTKAFTIGTSDEPPLQTILDQTYGMGAIDVVADQMNYQVWNIATEDTATVTLNVRVLAKEAHNTQTFGYYYASDADTFVPLFSVPPTAVGSTVPVSISVASVSAIGFAIETVGFEDNIWYSEWSLNTGNKDNLAVYNPSDDTYVLAFEDLQDFDNDHNDLVVEITGVTCVLPNGNGGNGGNGGDGGNGEGNGDDPTNGDDTGTGGDPASSSVGGGGRLLNPEGLTAGDSTTVDQVDERPTPETTLTPSEPRPVGMVGGEQVSIMPLGAADTGAGGTSSGPSHAIPLLALMALIASLVVLRRTAHEA